MNDVQRIGKYDVTSTLGEGAFGVVYEGFDPFLKRRLAIKMCTVEDRDLRKRFFREAEIAGRLEHKNVVRVYDFGNDGDRPFLVQELLDGEDLDVFIKRKEPASPRARLEILIEVARALTYAHEQGVVHRDVKPGNVRVLPGGRVKLMDFGIAKLAGAETQLTKEGVTVGTASYLPPEQVRADPLDHRADIFSFGVLAYELLSFERPFRGNTLSALVYQILYKVPMSLATVWSACPQALSDAIARCLAKKPDERWASMAELLPLLEAERGALDETPAESTTDADSADGAPPIDDTRPIQVVDDSEDEEDDTEAAIGVEPKPASVADSKDVPVAGAHQVEMPTMRLDPVMIDQVEEPLVQRAAEIGSLIAKGELETAMRELDATVQERRDATREGVIEIPDPPAPVAPPAVSPAVPPAVSPAVSPAVPPEASARPEAKTPHPTPPPTAKVEKPSIEKPPTQKPVAASAKATIEQAPPVKASAPKAKPKPPAKPKAKPVAAKPSVQPTSAVESTPVADPKPVTTGTTTDDAAPSRGLGRWLAIAAAAMLALLILLFMLRGGGEAPPQEASGAPATPPRSVAPVPAPSTPPIAISATDGYAHITPTPWAEIIEIVDTNGQAVALPTPAYAPRIVALEPGSYAITLAHPDADEPVSCTVEVILGGFSMCEASLVEIDTLDYFKDTGWWR